MKTITNILDVGSQEDGIYTVSTDNLNVYIVFNKTYWALPKTHYELILKERLETRSGLDADTLVKLRDGGYSVAEIQALRKDDLI